MQYHHYTKDSLLTSWLPPLAHIENDHRCTDIAQPHFQCGSESHKAVKRAPSTAQRRLVQRPDGVSVVVSEEFLDVFNSNCTM